MKLINKKNNFWVEEWGGTPLTCKECVLDEIISKMLHIIFDIRKKAIENREKIVLDKSAMGNITIRNIFPRMINLLFNPYRNSKGCCCFGKTDKELLFVGSGLMISSFSIFESKKLLDKLDYQI